MAKYTTLKLNLEAGKATPTPPVSTILGQNGVNINKFCTEYNKKTMEYIGLNIPVHIHIIENKEFKLTLHYPSFSYLIKKYSYKHIISISILKKIMYLKKKELHPITYVKLLHTIKKTLLKLNIKIIFI